jgi:hypothetical protein
MMEFFYESADENIIFPGNPPPWWECQHTTCPMSGQPDTGWKLRPVETFTNRFSVFFSKVVFVHCFLVIAGAAPLLPGGTDQSPGLSADSAAETHI